jgi:cell wall-associated NlpC family hydrolase
MAVAGWVADYIGIPYEEHGRTSVGCDCWGLVRLVLFERFGKILPSLTKEYEAVDPGVTARLVDQTRALVNAQMVTDPLPGDIAVMRSGPHPSAHVGIVVRGGYLLHTDRGVASHVDRLDSPRIANRLEGFYRA